MDVFEGFERRTINEKKSLMILSHAQQANTDNMELILNPSVG